MKKSHILLLLMLSSLAMSCIRYRQMVNFNEGPAFPAGPLPALTPYRIQAEDLLQVAVSVDDPEASTLFAPAQQQGAPTAPTHVVDASGAIHLPLIGRVQVAGLSAEQARDSIEARLRVYYRQPTVSLRYAQFRITVLGEVRAPSTFLVQRERLSLLEALGMAGDLTHYADRSRILVIRESQGVREFAYLNLHTRNVFESPYYYLQPGDVVYAEPLRAKTGSVSDQANKVLPYLSLGTVILNLLIILSRN